MPSFLVNSERDVVESTGVKESARFVGGRRRICDNSPWRDTNERETVGWNWFAIVAGTMAVAVANVMDAQATESVAAEEAYAQACLAPYRNEFAGWRATQLDEDAYWRAVLAARAAAADSCSAFVERFERDGQSGAPESPYLRDARDLLAGTRRRRCIEARVVSEVVRNAESLYELALCRSGKEGTALLREAVEIDPGHLSSLRFLTFADLDSQTRAEYGESLYRRSEDIFDRESAAKAIIEWAVDRGDSAAVQAIRERFKRDLLNEPPLDRCTWHLDDLGLEEICLEAIESVAADALVAGEALPDRVVSLAEWHFWETDVLMKMYGYVRSEAEVAEMLAAPGMRAQLAVDWANAPEYLETLEDDVELAKFLRGDPDFVKRVDHDVFLTDVLGREPWAAHTSARAERLKAVLENHPKPLRTSKHYLALAAFPGTWRERIALLRDAVEVESGHVGARCELAQTLEATGDLAGARREYRELLAYDQRRCDAQASLADLDNRAPTEAVSLDEPHSVRARY